MMFGPNIKYNYKTRYSTDMTDRPREFEDDNTPFRHQHSRRAGSQYLASVS